MPSKDINIKQMAQFVFWGGLNTFLSISVYWLFVYLGFNIYVANALAVFISVFSGHFFNKKKVFKSEESHTLRKYCLLWLCFYLISSLLLMMFVGVGVDKYLAAVFAGVILVPVSFFVQKIMIFLPHKNKDIESKGMVK